MPKDKVLIVDDEPMIQLTLSEAVRRWGYEPVGVGTVAAALEAFEAEQPAAVLLDVNLPDGSGLDALREIKRRQPQAVVIMITAEVRAENAIAALRGGAADFICKPIDLNEVQLALDNEVKAKRRHKEMEAVSQPRLLIVSDSVDHLNNLKSALKTGKVKITGVTTSEALRQACGGEHDLAIIAVGPDRITEALKTLRESPTHSEITVLVEASRIAANPSLAKVLPQYRAMPCSQAELIGLARRRLASITAHWEARKQL